MLFKPRHDYLLVKVDPAPTQVGAILLPQNAQKRFQQPTGTVVQVGPGKYSETGAQVPVGVAVGERVVFGKHVGTDIEDAGDNYKLMREIDIMGVV